MTLKPIYIKFSENEGGDEIIKSFNINKMRGKSIQQTPVSSS
jgi:hypothetical protein